MMGRPGIVLAIATITTLAGCEGTVQDQFGLSNRAPDEFQVVRRAPLVVPPDYNLKPPGEAAAEAAGQQSRQTRAILTGRDDTVSINGASSGEQALLAAATLPAMPNIRTQLLEDVGAIQTIDESRFLAILDWQRPVFDGDQAIDPANAADELRESGRAARVVTNRLTSIEQPEESQ